MIHFTLDEVAYLTGGLASIPSQMSQTFNGVSIDTRTLSPHNLFFAITGHKADGHHYLAVARQKYAAGAVLKYSIASVTLPQILVRDPACALGQLCQAWRMRMNLPVIAITGSNGKTTVKNIIATILTEACQQQTEQVLASIGNSNNHLGVPLTLARLDSLHQYAVLEMGMNHFGEIAYLSQMTQPTIAVITQASPAHLAGVHDLEGVARAKAEIFSGLTQDGIAVLNYDDSYYAYWHRYAGSRRCINFGFHSSADICLSHAATAINAHHQQQPIHISTPSGGMLVHCPLLGTYNLYNILAATATAIALHIPLFVIKRGLENVRAAPGRMQSYSFCHEKIRFIDDSYNANPGSMAAAIATLSVIPGKKVLVLGDMKELGCRAVDWHNHLGTIIKNSNIDYLMTHGALMAHVASIYGEGAMHFDKQEELIAAMHTLLLSLIPPITVLVKGSRSMQMEKVIYTFTQLLK